MVNTFADAMERRDGSTSEPGGNPGLIALAMVEGLLFSESLYLATIVWAGGEFPCTCGPEYGGKMIDEGGWRLHAKVQIHVRREAFPESGGTPQLKQTLQLRRNPTAPLKSYRIDGLTNLYDLVLILDCNDPAQGA